MTLSRPEVYVLLDEERDHQDAKMEEYSLDHPVAEWVILLEQHVKWAKQCVYNMNYEAAMGEVRKVGALAVAAIEDHGAPSRRDEIR